MTTTTTPTSVVSASQPKLDNPITLSLQAKLLRPSPLNPADRSNLDLSELKNSILEQGVLSSLTVRPYAADPSLYEVVCGECRLTVTLELIQEGTFPEDYELPVILRDLSDAESVLAGAEENIRRKDMNPLEILRAYQSALKCGATLSRIAVSFNTTEQKVLRRIAVLERGDEAMLEALRTDKLDLNQAAVIVAAPFGLRPMLLTRALEGLDPRGLRELATRGGIPTSSAMFDLSAHDHLIERDGLFGLMPDRFSDLNAFFELQRAWCLEEVSRLQKLEAGSEAISQYLSSPTLELRKLGLEADDATEPQGFVVWMHPTNGEVQILGARSLGGTRAQTSTPARAHTQQAPSTPSTIPSSAPSAAPTATPTATQGQHLKAKESSASTSPRLGQSGTSRACPLPKAAIDRAYQARTAALQQGLAGEYRGPGMRRVMALVLLGLDGTGVRSVGIRHSTEFAPKGVSLNTLQKESPLQKYQTLLAMNQEVFQITFTTTVCNLLFDSGSIGSEAQALVAALEREATLDQEAFFTLDKEYLEAFTKDDLWELAKSLPPSVVPGVKKGQKKSEMVASLLRVAELLRAMNWMPSHFWPDATPGPLRSASTSRGEVTADPESSSEGYDEEEEINRLDSTEDLEQTLEEDEDDELPGMPLPTVPAFRHTPNGGGGFPMIQASSLHP